MTDNSISRKETGEKLACEWESVSNLFLNNEEPYYDDCEDEEETDSFEMTLENCKRLVYDTKEYFTNLSVRGRLCIEDFELFEALSAFKFLPLIITSEKNEEKDIFDYVCKEAAGIIETLEPVTDQEADYEH